MVPILLILAGVFHRPLFFGNWGVVDPGRVYRSAQPTSRLDAILDDHQIRTVLNLRGGKMDDWWYRDELEATQERGIAFYDLSMSATKRPKRGNLLSIIDVIKNCEYPLLVHCKQGADRTGLACALYRMIHENQPPEQAASEFSVFHGHIPLGGTERLHQPLDEYAAWLKAEGLTHSPERLTDWVRHKYQAEDPLDQYQKPATGPRRRESKFATGR